MKTILYSTIAALAMTFSGTPSLAATGGRQDHSSMVVWAFLGFCALIVIAQLLPAIRHAWQAARTEKERKTAAAMVHTADK
jgi:hypothetical protein